MTKLQLVYIFVFCSIFQLAYVTSAPRQASRHPPRHPPRHASRRVHPNLLMNWHPWHKFNLWQDDTSPRYDRIETMRKFFRQTHGLPEPETLMEKVSDWFENLISDDYPIIASHYDQHFTEPPDKAFKKWKNVPKCEELKKKNPLYVCAGVSYEYVTTDDTLEMWETYKQLSSNDY